MICESILAKFNRSDGLWAHDNFVDSHGHKGTISKAAKVDFFPGVEQRIQGFFAAGVDTKKREKRKLNKDIFVLFVTLFRRRRKVQIMSQWNQIFGLSYLNLCFILETFYHFN
jgi:hypothetical protein